MTHDLVSGEGVDEGSAASTAEELASVPDVVGAPVTGEPAEEADPAPPAGRSGAEVDGQTLELGEG